MKAETIYKVPFWLKVRREILRAVFRPLFHLLFKIKFEGKENIPLGTAYILAYNHVSLFEPPLLLAFWPEQPEAVAGHDVWERGGQGLLVKGYGAIPVKRGEYDRNVIEQTMKVLKSSKPVMISPEGGRSHAIGMRRAWPGVAYLVDKAGVPVLPVAIEGTHPQVLKEALRFKRPQLTIRIGEPFTLPPIAEVGEARRQARQRNADEVMLHIAAMLPEKYHGVYTDGHAPEDEG